MLNVIFILSMPYRDYLSDSKSTKASKITINSKLGSWKWKSKDRKQLNEGQPEFFLLF